MLSVSIHCDKLKESADGGHAVYLIKYHYNDVIMSAMASPITSLTIVCSAVYSMCRSKKTSKLRVIGLCARNSPVIGEFPAQKASNAENVSIWWRHHVCTILFSSGYIVVPGVFRWFGYTCIYVCFTDTGSIVWLYGTCKYGTNVCHIYMCHIIIWLPQGQWICCRAHITYLT